jgi:hypothetical protein
MGRRCTMGVNRSLKEAVLRVMRERRERRVRALRDSTRDPDPRLSDDAAHASAERWDAMRHEIDDQS